MGLGRIAAILLAGGGVLFALFAIRPWSSTAPTGAAIPGDEALDLIRKRDLQAARSAELRSSATADPATLAATIATFRESLHNAVVERPLEIETTPRDIDAIIALACERLELLVRPNYDAYVSHVQRVTGLPRESKALNDRLMDRQQWEANALRFAGCAVDPTQAEMRATYVQGQITEASIFAGHFQTLQHKLHPFVELGHGWPKLDVPADVVEVRVPIGTTDSISGDPITVFFVIKLARVPPSQSWVPWQVGINNPSEEGYALPPPL